MVYGGQWIAYFMGDTGRQSAKRSKFHLLEALVKLGGVLKKNQCASLFAFFGLDIAEAWLDIRQSMALLHGFLVWRHDAKLPLDKTLEKFGGDTVQWRVILYICVAQQVARRLVRHLNGAVLAYNQYAGAHIANDLLAHLNRAFQLLTLLRCKYFGLTKLVRHF